MKKIVLITGAGISMEAPSNLPSWWEYNKAIIKVIRENALKCCPEAKNALEKLDIEKSLPVQCISDVIVNEGAGKSYFPLLDLLNGSKPNLNHFAIASLALQKKLRAIVSTNYDTLIEAAFQRQAIPLVVVIQKEMYVEAVRSPICSLLKIHGSANAHSTETFIDTVKQKATGLSEEKRFALKPVLSNCNIVVMGFSGADLDFDIDYLPFSDAIASGSTVTWIVKPGMKPNHNVTALSEKYKEKFQIVYTSFSDFFIDNGVDVDSIKIQLSTDILAADPYEERKLHIEKTIQDLFMEPHIGLDGCVGYCISLLHMMGEQKAASELADVYETKLDLNALSIFAVLGINQLALQKFRDGKYEHAKRWFNAEIQCHNKMYELNCEICKKEKQYDRIAEIEQETAGNLRTCYINLGNVFATQGDFSEAKKCYETANELVGLDKRSPYFQLARVNYQLKKDADQYLDELRQCRISAKSQGQLRLLAEILCVDTELRLRLGEYFLAKRQIVEMKSILKNVGVFDLDIQFHLLEAEYYLRTCDIDHSLTIMKETVNQVNVKDLRNWKILTAKKLVAMFPANEETLSLLNVLCPGLEMDFEQIERKEPTDSKNSENDIPPLLLESLPENSTRRAIVLHEYLQKKETLPHAFQKLCIQYIKDNKWMRLRDTAECYLNAAILPADQSIALYYLGCSYYETSDYPKAKEYFEQVLQMAKQADPLHLAWAHIELANISILSEDTGASALRYSQAKEILRTIPDEMISVCMAHVQRLTQLNKWDMAASYVEDLLNEAHTEAEQKELSEFLSIIHRKQKNENEVIPKNWDELPPETIANEANRLFDQKASRDEAWKLIYLAKDKYEKQNNREGVGKCENNIAMYYLKEGNHTEAEEHFFKSMKIKEDTGNVSGAIEQLANLISDSEDAEKYVNYAEAHMPEYQNANARYRLYFALFIYFAGKEAYAKVLKYGRMALEGIDYLSMESKDKVKSLLINSISELEKIYEPMAEPDSPVNELDARIGESIRLYKCGNTDDSLRRLEEQKEQFKNDKLSLGKTEGTIGNLYLHIKRDRDAIQCFDRAIEYFSEVQQDVSYDFILTAINGKSIALDRLGEGAKSMELLKDTLKNCDMERMASVPLVISICNRLLSNTQRISAYDDTFTVILNHLNRLEAMQGLSHELKGTVFHAFGLLYYSIEDQKNAVTYFEEAIQEFIACNSPYRNHSEQMLLAAKTLSTKN